MKKMMTLILSILVSMHVGADEGTTVKLQQGETLLGYGAGEFPQGTIVNDAGYFEIYVPAGAILVDASFSENYDEMCEVTMIADEGNVLYLVVGASGAESSRCVLDISLSTGETFQVIGIFSSGE